MTSTKHTVLPTSFRCTLIYVYFFFLVLVNITTVWPGNIVHIKRISKLFILNYLSTFHIFINDNEIVVVQTWRLPKFQLKVIASLESLNVKTDKCG